MKKPAKKAQPETKDWKEAAQKIGEASESTFIFSIKRSLGCPEETARKVFADAHDNGEIICTGMAGLYPGLPKFKTK